MAGENPVRLVHRVDFPPGEPFSQAMQQTGSEPSPPSGENRRPEAIRRSMVRTMSAVAVILAAVVTLAVAAGWMAVRAGRHQERAEAAELQGKIQVWHSYLDQAG